MRETGRQLPHIYEKLNKTKKAQKYYDNLFQQRRSLCPNEGEKSNSSRNNNKEKNKLKNCYKNEVNEQKKESSNIVFVNGNIPISLRLLLG